VSRHRRWFGAGDGFSLHNLIVRRLPAHVRRLGRAIAWTPADDPYYLLAGMLSGSKGLPALSVTQSAILDLQREMKCAQSTLPYGLLAGDVCVSPESNVRYLLLDDVTPARTELSEVDIKSQLTTELRSLVGAAQSRGKIPIGWYIGGIGDDLQLDSEDLSLHREIFPEAWQVVLLHDDTASEERGAFLRHAQGSNRLYAVPFFELLPDSTGMSVAERETALHWVNYHSDAPVSRLRASGRAPAGSAARAFRSTSRNIASWLASWRRSIARMSPPWGGPSLPDVGATPSSITARPSTKLASRSIRGVDVATPPRAVVAQSPVVALEAVRPAQITPESAPDESLRGVFVFLNGELVGYSPDFRRDDAKRPSIAWRRLLLLVVIVALAVIAIVAVRASTTN
jgi:hypothetical protein